MTNSTTFFGLASAVVGAIGVGVVFGQQHNIALADLIGAVVADQRALAVNAVNEQIVIVTTALHAVPLRLGVVAHGGGVEALGEGVPGQLLHHEMGR